MENKVVVQVAVDPKSPKITKNDWVVINSKQEIMHIKSYADQYTLFPEWAKLKEDEKSFNGQRSIKVEVPFMKLDIFVKMVKIPSIDDKLFYSLEQKIQQIFEKDSRINSVQETCDKYVIEVEIPKVNSELLKYCKEIGFKLYKNFIILPSKVSYKTLKECITEIQKYYSEKEYFYTIEDNSSYNDEGIKVKWEKLS